MRNNNESPAPGPGQPGVSTLHASHPLFLKTVLRPGFCYDPHFMGAETEAQEATVQVAQLGKPGVRAVQSGSKTEFHQDVVLHLCSPSSLVLYIPDPQVFGAEQLLIECFPDERRPLAPLKRHTVEPSMGRECGGVLRTYCRPGPVLGCFCSIIPFVQKVIHGMVIRCHLGQLITQCRDSGLQCPTCKNGLERGSYCRSQL